MMKIKDKKLELLKALYSHKFDGKYYDVLEILKQFGSTSRGEAYSIAKALNDLGFIKMISTKDGTDAEITSGGVEFIEEQELSQKQYEPTDIIGVQEKELLKINLMSFRRD